MACLAMVPSLFVEVYFGYAGKHAAHIAGRTVQGVVVHDLAVFAGLVVCGLAMARMSKMAREAVIQAVNSAV